MLSASGCCSVRGDCVSTAWEVLPLLLLHWWLMVVNTLRDTGAIWNCCNV
jgi:hypothetical protein